MFGEYSTREFLMWIVGIFVAAMITIFGAIYVVDILVVPPNDSPTTHNILKK
jgi:hypothetical protein